MINPIVRPNLWSYQHESFGVCNGLVGTWAATQAASGLAALHTSDDPNIVSVAHTDISPKQFIQVQNGVYKLNDFTRARFIPVKKVATANNTFTTKACTYRIVNNPGKNRSPEEYLYQPQTEKVDIYSLGNFFYMLLQGEWPFANLTVWEAQNAVKANRRPTFYYDVSNSTHPVDQALKIIMIQCHVQDPMERPTAVQVQTYLVNTVRATYPTKMKEWGLA